MAHHLILASTSAYKKMLMERLKIPFTCVAPNTKEQAMPNETAQSLAIRLAKEKALAVLAHYPDSIIIGSDQVGEIKGKILGKPGTFDKAVAQITNQSGQKVYFHSAICVVMQNKMGDISHQSKINTTEVHFKTLNQQQIKQYLKVEQPYDCAGSFISEGLGISLFSSINSDDPTSLIGLPLIDLCSILESYDVEIPNV
ncbi:MAG: Maf-like protein YceF [Cellvibrionales bacterium UBA7375]|nr:MAG: Maf-like protein YceF [Cellvibrionales bacterium UBA7375]